MSQSAKKVADAAAIPEIWRVSAKDHDRAAATAIVYLEHEGWDLVSADVVALGGPAAIPPPGTPVMVTWSPSRLGGFRPAGIIAQAPIAARKAAAAAAPRSMPLEIWLAAVQSLGMLTDYSAGQLAGLLTALEQYGSDDAEAWNPMTEIDAAVAADILWKVTPQNHLAIERQDPQYALHGIADDPRLPSAVLAVHDAGGRLGPLVKLVGPIANSVAEDHGDDLEAHVARLRHAMTTAGERRAPYLADSAYQARAYLFLLAPDLACALASRGLLKLYT